MNLGFETCGNATLIAYDAGIPVLTTDPWLHGAQYFGSWTLPFRFTAAQQEAFAAVRYVWLSHGHPDHLNLESLATFRDKTLLVPDHRGNRILGDLKAAVIASKFSPTIPGHNSRRRYASFAALIKTRTRRC